MLIPSESADSTEQAKQQSNSLGLGAGHWAWSYAFLKGMKVSTLRGGQGLVWMCGCRPRGTVILRTSIDEWWAEVAARCQAAPAALAGLCLAVPSARGAVRMLESPGQARRRVPAQPVPVLEVQLQSFSCRASFRIYRGVSRLFSLALGWGTSISILAMIGPDRKIRRGLGTSQVFPGLSSSAWRVTVPAKAQMTQGTKSSRRI
ncbi:hypothetical protein THAOC_11594 [Thalassiosira oceanica]|uniref:Uncharacterized protein n=1 Tax=Thalassiosira oceanica TaxID=159749 RepID=K0T263_THAOC|nr:hypothetical protein THAOC_11594 [Thalassiosira oceanica]|eukprot:EJK67381.1 hypothetical protein THAOC_11594 [Thalassiosira oceanica]